MPETSGGQSARAAPAPAADRRPLVAYDGDCGFCAYWARYWQSLTGDRLDYRPYQEVLAHYPAITHAEFQRAVQFIAPDGRRVSGAEASFRTLSYAPGKGYWLALYRHLPGFAAASEMAYAFIAAHRAAFFRLTLLLWGKGFAPPRYALVSFLFLRVFGFIWLAAFLSFAVQAPGLIGSHGILPVAQLVDALAGPLGSTRFALVPMVFWLDDGDLAIQAVCWAGVGLAALLIVNVLPRLSLFLLYALYLSLFYAGQEFTNFQWDTFLLETGFVALLLSFAAAPGIWLLRWLLFRFIFMSGVVKLLSGDPHWWDLSALSYHFWTQPLPTPLAWYAAQLPPGVLRFATGSLFFIELVLPFLIFCPRRLRFVAAFGILLLQGGILLTGNYNWFNLQTMLLCLPLFDDAAIRKLLPRRAMALLAPRARTRDPRRMAATVAIDAIALLLVFCSLVEMDKRFGGDPPQAAQAIDSLIGPLQIVSAYGLFAVMTTTRHEIIVQGSDDGVDWRDYEFRYKPGDVARRPPWNIAYQPRLDWQMWFAALDNPQRLPWFSRFVERLLENDPAVTALLAKNPFPAKPPTYVRAQLYDYTYAGRDEQASGRWWHRRLIGLYFPAVRLHSE